jgi:hypothetical protein
MWNKMLQIFDKKKLSVMMVQSLKLKKNINDKEWDRASRIEIKMRSINVKIKAASLEDLYKKSDYML